MKFKKNQVEVYPDKRVEDSKGKKYYLGVILQAGSAGGKLIEPVKSRYLMFKNKEGNLVKVESVIRGTIHPIDFMSKVEKDMRDELPKIYTRELLNSLQREAKK